MSCSTWMHINIHNSLVSRAWDRFGIQTSFLTPELGDSIVPFSPFFGWGAEMQSESRQSREQRLKTVYVYLYFPPFLVTTKHQSQWVAPWDGQLLPGLVLPGVWVPETLRREKLFDFQWEIIPYVRVREQPATHTHLQQFLFRSTRGMRWSGTILSTPKTSPQNTQPRLFSAQCNDYNRALVTSSARGEKESLSLPHASAFHHACFSVCSSEGLVVTCPRSDTFISSPPSTSYSLKWVAWI